MSISAKFLTAVVNNVPITGTCEFSVNERADRIEATTGAHNGRGRKDVGVIDTMIRVMLYVDATTGSVTGLRPGTALINLELFADADAEDAIYLISGATIFDSTFRGQVRDKLVWECEIEANGDTVFVNNPN